MVCKMAPGDNTPAVDTGDEIRMAMIMVQDMTSATIQVGRTTLRLASTVLVKTLLENVASSSSFVQGTFDLLLQHASDRDTTVVLNDLMDKTLQAAGFVCDDGLTRNILIIANKRTGPPVMDSTSDMCQRFDPSIQDSSQGETSSSETILLPSLSTNYSLKRNFVGLVNQAMTCYLNSLIQTLFMTPEFRNALYRWRFDGTEEEQAKSIPFQLQCLFLKLQTSDKPSILTTNLTRSFGWDSSEAWQQHDIQELCRVMFDALEHKFRNTEQSDLISRLYEGKMMDYVRCLECRTEKAREDTFLDIPLPVRPFGSQTAYASIEEALKAFVTPETLDGNNQYWCDICSKKCDAHKGLKFSRFPYLLTLHLKRFDFDYTTLHRIKLNDKVTFPEFLDLASFLVIGSEEQSGNGSVERPASASNKDSQDTAIEDSMSEASESSRANSSNDAESQDDDEGIDVRTEGCASSISCASATSTSGDHHQNRKNSNHNRGGQHNYELFSIMIHSGSASGGHYYAYIKDFPTGEWHCFNDQTVSRITYDDIRKTYGGGPARSAGYFASAYTSSTNAYMLMYRQINKERNADFIRPSDFPEHIQQLLQRFKEEEENARAAEEQEKNTCKVQLFCHHPGRGRIDVPFKVQKDTTLRQAVSLAYEQINDLSNIGIGIDRCRLVKYNQFYDSIECSWDHRLDETIDRIFGDCVASGKSDLLLEIAEPGRSFEVIKPGSLAVRLVMIDCEAGEISSPIFLRLPANSNVGDLKYCIKSTLNIDEDPDHIHMVSIRYSEVQRLSVGDKSLRSGYGFMTQRTERVYATVFRCSDENAFFESCKPRFYDLIDQYENAIQVRITLPKFDQETLDRLGIPASTAASSMDGLSETMVDSHPVISSGTRPVVSPVLMEDEGSFSPEDAASDDSLSHLERERAVSEGEEEDEENRRRRREDVEEFAAESANFRSDYADCEDLIPRLPNSTSSASEDSSLSLTDSDRTLLGDPPEMEEGFICDEEEPQQTRRSQAHEEHQLTSDGGDTQTQTQRRNALISDHQQDSNEAVGGAEKPECLPTKYFFKVISSSDIMNEKHCMAMVDKRIPQSNFKSELESLLNVSAEFLLLYKKSSQSLAGSGEREWVQPNETLETLGDEPNIVVRLGRALRPGELRGKLYQLNLNGVASNEERSKFLFEWVLSSGIRIGLLKREILAEMKKQFGIEIPPEKCILRRKSWRTPSNVFGDEDEILNTEAMYIFKNWEMFVQMLDPDDPEDVVSKYRGADSVIFTRRWRPSTMTLEDFADTPLPALNRTELSKVLCARSGLPPEKIEIAKAPGSFPCECSLLSIQEDSGTWVPLIDELDKVGVPAEFKYPCCVQGDGEVLFWREKGEQLKKLTDQERRDVLRRENSNSDGSLSVGATSNYSPRRERPLRIFVDSPVAVSKSEQPVDLD